MFNKYSLGATVLVTFVLVVVGINRAFSWLRSSPDTDSFADSGDFIEVDAIELDSNREARTTNDRFSDRFIEDTHPPNTRNGERSQISSTYDQMIRPSDDSLSSDPLSEDVLSPTPLETTDTYIQRQQKAEFDELTADSHAERILLDTDDTVAEQSDTRTDLDQLELADSDDTGSTAAGFTATGSTASGSTATTSQSVPALW